MTDLPLKARGEVSLILIVSVMLGLLYFWALSSSMNGWGYPHYYRRHYFGPSWFYWGPQTYHDPSVRTGSPGGPGHASGGFHGGK